MAEPFNTSIELHGEDARRFHEYDQDPFKFENAQSRDAAKRARVIAAKIRL
jgi:hypothetical protein